MLFKNMFSKAEKQFYSKKAILGENYMQMWKLRFEASHLNFMIETPHIQGRRASYSIIFHQALTPALTQLAFIWPSLASCTCCYLISISLLFIPAMLSSPWLAAHCLLCLPLPIHSLPPSPVDVHKHLQEPTSQDPHLPQSILSSAASMIA